MLRRKIFETNSKIGDFSNQVDDDDDDDEDDYSDDIASTWSYWEICLNGCRFLSVNSWPFLMFDCLTTRLAGWRASFAWFFLQMDNERAQVRQFLWMVLYEYDVHYRLTKPKASPERIVANEILYSYCFDGHRQTYFVWNEPCEPCADVMGSHMIEIQNGDWR